MGSMGLVFIFWGKDMLSFYTKDQELIEEAYSPLLILGMIQVVDAYHMVIACALRGAGLQDFCISCIYGRVLFSVFTFCLLYGNLFRNGISWVVVWDCGLGFSAG